MIKDENFIVIQGFMLNKLKLKGSELIVFALIYGFSQAGDCWFTGSQSYIAEWAGLSTRRVIDVLNRLIDKGYLIKQNYQIEGVTYCKYAINHDCLIEKNNDETSGGDMTKRQGGYDETSGGDMTKRQGGYDETSENNIEYNINNNIDNNIIDRSEFFPDQHQHQHQHQHQKYVELKNLNCEDLVKYYGVDRQIAFDFMQVRKSKNAKNLTKTAMAAIVNCAKQCNMSLNQVLTVCIERNWTSCRSEWLIKIANEYNNLQRELANNSASNFCPL